MILPYAQAVDIGHGRGRLAAPAARSLARVDRAFGRPADVNEAWRSPEQANANYARYQAYLRDPKNNPWAPIALPADESVHCVGYAVDTDDTSPEQMKVWNDHGWYWTVYRNGKLIERWHLEYFPDRDNHRNDPDTQEDDMYDDKARAEINEKLDDIRDGLGLGNARGSGGDVSMSANLQKVARVLWAGGPDVDAQLGATNSVFGLVIAQHAQVAALTAALVNVQAGNVDLAAVTRAAEEGARRALDGLTLTATA